MPDPPPVMIATGVGCDVTVSLWRIVRDVSPEKVFDASRARPVVGHPGAQFVDLGRQYGLEVVELGDQIGAQSKLCSWCQMIASTTSTVATNFAMGMS